MIFKSDIFNRQFENDYKNLIISRNKTPRYKGSYANSNNNELITDIDIEQHVTYNKTLIEIILKKIKLARRYNFYFVKFDCGYLMDFPWIIDTAGDCSFDLTTLSLWLKNLEKLSVVPENILEDVKDQLKSNIDISKLLSIQYILLPYIEINWTVKDIENGYKYVNNIKYDLLSSMKEYTSVLEFIYEYDNKYISVDVALVQPKLKTEKEKDLLHRFYMKNYYKILKYIRWKLDPPYKQYYNDLMNELKLYRYISYQITILLDVRKYKLLSPEKEYALQRNTMYLIMSNNIPKQNSLYMVKNWIDTYINNTCKQYITYFENNISKDKKYNYNVLKDRISQQETSISMEEIKERTDKGIKCPFYNSSMEEYRKIHKISTNLLVDANVFSDYVYKTSIKLSLPISEVIKSLNNQLSINLEGEIAILKNNDKIIGKYKKENIDKLRYYILNK